MTLFLYRNIIRLLQTNRNTRNVGGKRTGLLGDTDIRVLVQRKNLIINCSEWQLERWLVEIFSAVSISYLKFLGKDGSTESLFIGLSSSDAKMREESERVRFAWRLLVKFPESHRQSLALSSYIRLLKPYPQANTADSLAVYSPPTSGRIRPKWLQLQSQLPAVIVP